MLDEARRAAVQILCVPETQPVGYRVDISTPTRTPAEWLQFVRALQFKWDGKWQPPDRK